MSLVSNVLLHKLHPIMVSPFYVDFEVCGLRSGSPNLHLGLGITSFILQKMVLLTSPDALHRPVFTLQYITQTLPYLEQYKPQLCIKNQDPAVDGWQRWNWRYGRWRHRTQCMTRWEWWWKIRKWRFHHGMSPTNRTNIQPIHTGNNKILSMQDGHNFFTLRYKKSQLGKCGTHAIAEQLLVMAKCGLSSKKLFKSISNFCMSVHDHSQTGNQLLFN